MPIIDQYRTRAERDASVLLRESQGLTMQHDNHGDQFNTLVWDVDTRAPTPLPLTLTERRLARLEQTLGLLPLTE